MNGTHVMSVRFSRPIIKLKNRFLYGESHILPNNTVADALFQLIGKKVIKPADLYLIGKMGYDVEMSGDKKDLKKDLTREDIDIELKYV